MHLHHLGILRTVQQPVLNDFSAASALSDSADALEVREAAFSSSGLTVNPVDADDRNEAFMLIMSALPSSIVTLVRDVPLGNAHALYTKLAAFFSRTTPANTHRLLQSFHSLVQLSGEKVATFIARLNACVLDLIAAGESISESTRIHRFLGGLLDQFDLERRMLRMPRPSSRAIFDKCCDEILAAEAMLTHRADARLASHAEIANNTTLAKALLSKEHVSAKQPRTLPLPIAQRPSHGFQRGQGDPARRTPNNECSRCGAQGHHSRSCDHPRQTCSLCREKNHHSRGCPTTTPNRTPAQLSATSEQPAVFAANYTEFDLDDDYN